MTALTFTLKSPPNQRLDLSPLTPDRLKGLSEREIAALPIGSTRTPVTVGDAFRIAMGDCANIRIQATPDRLDKIGLGMTGGSILVEGNAGAYAGCGLVGGSLVIKGNAGPWAGAGQRGGRIEIGGDAGDYLGGALPGAMSGMQDGVIVVKGNAGARAGDRMRRGLIVIEGAAGRYLGSRMIAGTIFAFGGAGALPGFLMRRGTLIIDGGIADMTPSFADCGRQELTILRLLSRQIASLAGSRAVQRLGGGVRRYAGDMATLGKGEILRIEA